jgi:hypothetical protein
MIADSRRHESRLLWGEQQLHFARLSGELNGLLPTLPTEGSGRGDSFIVAATLAHGGELEPAARILDADGLTDPAALPRNILQRPALQNLAVLADALDRPDLGLAVAAMLERHPKDLGVTGVAHPCGHHFVALALRAAGRWGEAVAHHDAALKVHLDTRHPLLALEARRELVRTLERAEHHSASAAVRNGHDPELLRRRVNADAEALGATGLTLNGVR